MKNEAKLGDYEIRKDRDPTTQHQLGQIKGYSTKLVLGYPLSSVLYPLSTIHYSLFAI